MSHGGANRAKHRWTLTDSSVFLQPTASLSGETQYIRASADASADAAELPPSFFFSFSLSVLKILLYILGYNHIGQSQKVAAGTSRVLQSDNDPSRGTASMSHGCENSLISVKPSCYLVSGMAEAL